MKSLELEKLCSNNQKDPIKPVKELAQARSQAQKEKPYQSIDLDSNCGQFLSNTQKS